jgi:hypothetical protein
MSDFEVKTNQLKKDLSHVQLIKNPEFIKKHCEIRGIIPTDIMVCSHSIFYARLVQLQTNFEDYQVLADDWCKWNSNPSKSIGYIF